MTSFLARSVLICRLLETEVVICIDFRYVGVLLLLGLEEELLGDAHGIFPELQIVVITATFSIIARIVKPRAL